jgi:hypothetical protein
MLIALAVLAITGSAVRADFVAAEMEPNNSFATRQLLPGGNGRVNGALAAGGGDVDHYRFSLTPGSSAAAMIINSVPPPPFGTDTVLGRLNDLGGIISVDDDSGFGFLSRQGPFAVAASGQVNLAVSGFPDFGLTGAHGVVGSYTLDVRELVSAADAGVNNTFATRQILAAGVNTVTGGVTPGDVDFFSFTNLEPGTIFGVNVTTGTYDTLIGLFSDAGALLMTDDDSGAGLLSAFAGLTVPASGVVTLAISAFPDFGLTGSHSATGTYQMTVFALQQTPQGVVIPEPSSVVLLGLGLAGLVGLGYRRLKRQAA